VRPGISGLAQVKGSRGGMEATEQLEKRLAYDLEYINNYSLLLDVKIAIATIYAVLHPSNAY
jgi:lipopolysaccharide/colanic/teichoic acid biosynthesis glycosyltransferase